MPPKKKQPRPGGGKDSSSSAAKSKPQQSSGAKKQAPKLQISEENERRLRRLLLNTERPAASAAEDSVAAAAAADAESRAQKAKRLRSIYDRLSIEGFTVQQIELGLAALNEGATFESALDWLCFNIPGNELPPKFSRGASASLEGEERVVKIVSTARDDWSPPDRAVDDFPKKQPEFSVRLKGHKKEESLDFGKHSQADWIRQYMEQEELEEEKEHLRQQKQEEDEISSCSVDSIVKEYHIARHAAFEAKQRGDKKSQEHFELVIRKIRQRLTTLGHSMNILESSENASLTDIPSMNLELSVASGISSCVSSFDSSKLAAEVQISQNAEESLIRREITDNDPADTHGSLKEEEEDEEDDFELDNMFEEDVSSSSEIVATNARMTKNKAKSLQLVYGNNLINIDELWKKGDSKMIPKAALQKLCQRLGWESPKYNKTSVKGCKFLYTVTILRTSSGRGKSRKSGGLTTIELPDKQKSFQSAEDGQNEVATFALYCLFPNAPISQILTERYASLIRKWETDNVEGISDTDEKIRRSDFVDSLLELKAYEPPNSGDAPNVPFGEKLPELYNRKNEGLSTGKESVLHKEKMSKFLKQEYENKMKMPKYLKILEARAALPIYQVKNDLLELLHVNDVIVVCGETGCGKTTQVPQFILDKMIELNLGGYCNIICTQPRRIAATSVAERVSDERCEGPPGCSNSLVGFQVRLESARNEKTKLLFCTTGILLRRLIGDKDLVGVSHVIVDEVHERSLLGDFMLIVLKDLIARRSASGSALKVILMSATVNSKLFSSYFGDCPVLLAEGRTHPVTTLYLEDVYEKLDYCLPLDSPASGKVPSSAARKLRNNSVDNRRGKKSLVLSSWGDDSVLEPVYINPYYDSNDYSSYSEKTRKNMKKLNEDVIDYDLVEELISFIDQNFPSGSILVFLPGVAEINSLADRLIATLQFGGSRSDWILPLHSSLSSIDQRKVFQTPPDGVRKVIVATDIAETSITIDDVVYVIDTGKHKEMRYNPQRKMSSMVEDWVSRANAKQRKGRAGRVKPGVCFCLYTRHRYEFLMRPFQVPELLRMPLTELCLHIKSLALGDIKSFLSKAIEPPNDDAISSAISLLHEVGALDGLEELTPLGYHLATLPVDVLIGKMMLYGAVFGCLSPILSIAAFLSYKFPFVFPKDEKQNAERAKVQLLGETLDTSSGSSVSHSQSDHMLLVVAYIRWFKALQENGPKAAQQFCRSHFLNSSVMYMIRDMRVQFGNLLADIGLITLPLFHSNDGRKKDKIDNWLADMNQPFNLYSRHSSIIKSILCAGLYPNVAARQEGIFGQALSSDTSDNQRSSWCDGKREVHIHPSSINFGVKNFQYPFLVFLEKVETNRIFLRDTSVISPYSILLFGGSVSIQHQMGIIIIDGWLKLSAPAQIAVLFKELRLMLHAVLKDLIKKPEVAIVVNNEVVKSIVQLLLEEEKSLS